MTIRWGASTLTFIALLVIARFVGAFVALMWPALVLSIAFHEAGHAWCARRVGFDVDRLVVGVGPTLVRTQLRAFPVELRLVPVVGWVEPVVPDLMSQFRSRRVAVHRRMALVFLAGPVASLVLGTTLSFAGMMAVRPQADAVPRALDLTGALTVQTAALPAQLVVRELGSLLPPYTGATDSNRPELARSHAEVNRSEGTQATTIVGFTRQGNRLVEEDGSAMGLILIGLVNLSLAAFNLLPVWGFDGYGVLSELVGTVGVRHRRRQVRARTLLRILGAACAIGMAMFIVTALWHDLFG